jgi:hypothetical protein
MKRCSIFMVILILGMIGSGCTNRESETNKAKIEDVSVVEVQYDIEKVFPDPLFAEIVEGKIIPTEIRHGVGGEGGYIQYPSKDTEVINKYIEALREFKIEKTIEDQNDFEYVADAVNDYIFYLEDGREFLISIDLNSYVIDREKGVQYVFEFNKKLSDLNREYDIDDVEEEPLREYSFSSVEDFYNLSDDDVIYLATHKYKTSDFIDDYKADSFSDFGIPLGEFECYEEVLLDPGGERQDYDLNKKISDQDFKKLADDYMNEFMGDLDWKIDCVGETDHYVEYRYASPQDVGFGRRCFYRNKFMISEIIDGNFFAGPVYLGELTVDNILSEGDFYLSTFDNDYLLWRGVEETATSVVYTYYCPEVKQSGEDYEAGQNQKAQILKCMIIYDKETHHEAWDGEVIRSVDIPGTQLIIFEPV